MNDAAEPAVSWRCSPAVLAHSYIAVAFRAKPGEALPWAVVLDQGIPSVAFSVWVLIFLTAGFSQDEDLSWWSLALQTTFPLLSPCPVTHFSPMAPIYNDRYFAILTFIAPNFKTHAFPCQTSHFSKTSVLLFTLSHEKPREIVMSSNNDAACMASCLVVRQVNSCTVLKSFSLKFSEHRWMQRLSQYH